VARIEATLGQLQTNDEAALHEPLLAMRRAELEFRASPDIRYERELSWWASRFSELLDERSIPEGTRINLALRLATYQHDSLGRMDANLAARGDLAAGDVPDGAWRATAAGDEAPVRWFDWMIAMTAVLAAAWLRFKSPVTAHAVGSAGSAEMVDQAARQVLLSTRLATRSAEQMDAITAEVRGLTGMARHIERAVKIAGNVSGQSRTLARIARTEADRAGDVGASVPVRRPAMADAMAD
jgi:hypothetical protein